MNSYPYAYPPSKASTGFGKTSDGFHGRLSALPKDPKVATAYVPFQTDFNTYDDAKALKAGTLFPCLDKPFLGSGTR